ncbi:hypothetical protein [Flavobacterium chungbukense]|uniref:Quinol oxidase subunit 4 n=1 Tax=Flavobacterium chungbukense TaxID=877464 RepID=A0ABP7XRN2_9FLAO|nr:hypothetical protein [Flavobacterium chungbukense]MCC4921148.1 hypothetical protein [Flavobacterium chungbukense]
MKTSKYPKLAVTIIIATFVTLSSLSCSTHVHTQPAPGKKIPPGQAKKMNGDKSAKAYAPGQQKKR